MLKFSKTKQYFMKIKIVLLKYIFYLRSVHFLNKKELISINISKILRMIFRLIDKTLVARITFSLNKDFNSGRPVMVISSDSASLDDVGLLTLDISDNFNG